MITIYRLKPAFQSLLRPLLAPLASAGVTANVVTLFAALLSLAYAAALLAWPQVAALWLGLPVLLFVRMALNAVDGMLAREMGQQSRLGAFLNELCDIASDSALLLALFALPSASPLAVGALVGAAALSETAGLVSQATGGARRYDGPFGKSDRAFVLGALGLVVGFGFPLEVWLPPLLWMFVMLALGTTVNRVRAALKEAA